VLRVLAVARTALAAETSLAALVQEVGVAPEVMREVAVL